MNIIDIIIACILLFGLVVGFKRGLFVEITSLVGLILGVYGAIYFSYFLSNFLKSRVSWDPSVIQIIAFAGTFLIIVIALVTLGKALTTIAETIMLGFFNKILGAIFGVLKFALILSIVLIIFGEFNKTLKFMNRSKSEDSVLYEPVKNFAPLIFPKLVSMVEDGSEK
jgi:membrane protein required for colicin V production